MKTKPKICNVDPKMDEEIDKSQIYCEQHAPHLADIDSGIVRDGITYLNF